MRFVKLKRNFYTRPTLKVAKELLGKYIVRNVGGKSIIGKIVETEAYIGPQDKASHAYLGKRTPRNKAEYLIGGHIYIYLVYGMHWQFNISTNVEGKPECVLIRALEPAVANKREFTTNITNKKFVKIRGRFVKIRDMANGPGKLCKYLKLNKSFYGEDLTKSKRIWLEDPALEPRATPPRRDVRGKQVRRGASRGEKIDSKDIKSGPRIGIDYAGPCWAKKPWRFWIKNNEFVSRR